MFFITGIAYVYGYGDDTQDRFYHPVIAENEGEAKDKVRAFYSDRGREVKDLEAFETIK